jgi:hypothetical protein
MEKKDNRGIVRLLSTLALSLVLLGFYYYSLSFSFFPFVMFGYMIAETAFIIVYLFYNRGFSRKGITEDMLPDEWDADKKREYIQDGKDRLKKSQWMLVIIISFLVTFICEAVINFLLPLVDLPF